MRVSTARRFAGRFGVPGDKSISHRLAIFGGVATGRTRISNFSTAADCASTLACLRRLGVSVRRDGTAVEIDGAGFDGLRAPDGVLDAGNSGTTIRLLAGVLAGRPFTSTLTGDESLRQRPMERVAAPLREMGARVATTEGRPPVTIEGGPLGGRRFDLPVASAQVKTALLLAGLQAGGGTTVAEPSPSRDHTERWLPAFGVTVDRDGLSSTVRASSLRGIDATVPGDVSSAAFLLAGALVVPGGHVRVEGVGLNPGRVAFLDVLRQMGARVRSEVVQAEPEPVGWIEAEHGALHGAVVDPSLVPALIDEVPALAAVATAADGVFELRGAAELRLKESDRIAALADVLGRMGARVEELPDGLRIEGGRPLRGAAVRARGDHRIAMAAAVAALHADGDTTIEDGDCVAVSFPEFPGVLREATR